MSENTATIEDDPVEVVEEDLTKEMLRRVYGESDGNA